LIAVLVGGLGPGLLAGAVGAAYLLFVKHPPSPIPSAGTPRMWYVSARGGPEPDRTLTSLAAALDRAGPGDTIRILDERIEDPAPVRVSSQTGVKNGVRVEAGTPSKVVTWTPRYPSRKHGALEIADVKDFTVSGLVLDLGGRVDYGVVVSRSCPGLTIEGVTVLAPSVAGFRFASAAGESDRPVRAHGCRVAARDRLEAALELTDGSRHIVFENGRLEGPGKAAVKLSGTVQGEVRSNRIYNFDRGITLAGDPPGPAAVDLTVTNNTFHTLQTGVDIQPQVAGLKRLSVLRNVFANTKTIAASKAAKVAGFQTADNARDKASREGNLPTGAAEIDLVFPAPNAKNDAQFLLAPPGKLPPNVGAD
jgi:hypothetical protein